VRVQSSLLFFGKNFEKSIPMPESAVEFIKLFDAGKVPVTPFSFQVSI